MVSAQISENTLYDIITMDTNVLIHLSKPMEYTMLRVNYNVNYGLSECDKSM